MSSSPIKLTQHEYWVMNGYRIIDTEFRNIVNSAITAGLALKH